MARPLVTSEGFADRLCAALGIDPTKTTRIVLDIKPADVIHVYIEQLGDAGLQDMDIPPLDVEPVVIKANR